MVVLDPHLELAFVQAGGQALAVVGLGGAADGLAALVEQNAVAAGQGRQGLTTCKVCNWAWKRCRRS